MRQKRAIIIGAGFGGLALGIRLQSLGFDTTIVEKLDGPGGRAYTQRVDGFTFDMGPTVITVPHLIEELFALEVGQPHLAGPDFPPEVMTRVRAGTSGGPATARYVDLIPILPFYRIQFDDGTHFDYDGDPAHTRAQIRTLAPEDLAGYARFHADAQAIFQRGFLELGYTYFGDMAQMVRIAPDLVKLDALRTLFSFVKKYFKNPKMQQVFSFEPLLIGGNPLHVPAIYAMIHFVEKTWGIHYAKGGMGALVQGFARKFTDLGGTMRYNSPVARIHVTGPRGGAVQGRFGDKYARGVLLADGAYLPADLVISNADYAHTYLDLIEPEMRPFQPDARVKLAQQSMSLVVIYFGFRADPRDAQLRHHTIILGPRYEGLLRDIFDRKILAEDFSQYLHIPTLTDPSLAPPGHHAAYTLVPVPNNASGLDWSTIGPEFAAKILTFLDERGYLPDLRQRLVHSSFITPDYFTHTLNSWLGNGFGLEPILRQSAFFRPHNRSTDIHRLYLVGANTQPGAGTPAVMMSAKMTARLIAEDFGLSLTGDGASAYTEAAVPHAAHAEE
jgi:phytoene desaturase